MTTLIIHSSIHIFPAHHLHHDTTYSVNQQREVLTAIMTSLRRFRCTDLFRISAMNLDFLTENYHIPYYLQYALLWPNCFILAEQYTAASNTLPSNTNTTITTPTTTSPTITSTASLTTSSYSAADFTVCGYMMGKVEGSGHSWHGHVSALSISPDYRRLGVAHQLMNVLELVCDRVYKAYYVDLYVRMSNVLAIAMYKQFGYIVYRQVIGYYSGEEDAFGQHQQTCTHIYHAS